MAALVVINGRANFVLEMNNDDLRRVMKDAISPLRAGEGFWATSAADHSTGPTALWVPSGSIVQFQFDPGHTWRPTSMERPDWFLVENDPTVMVGRSKGG